MVSTYIGSSKFNKNMTFDSISRGAFKIHNYRFFFQTPLGAGLDNLSPGRLSQSGRGLELQGQGLGSALTHTFLVGTEQEVMS